MRIGQIRWNNQTTAAVFDDSSFVRPVPDYTVLDLIRLAELEKIASPTWSAPGQHAREPADPLLPIHPPKSGPAAAPTRPAPPSAMPSTAPAKACTPTSTREPRPEIFFKGTARVCVGTGQAIGIRPDSQFTAPEPELAIVLGPTARIFGYTLANDVSAWDIERENALYLPQSKVYTACCALGPVIVTPDEIADPYKLTIEMTVRRGDEVTFSGKVSTSELNRKFEQLLDYLLRANPVPAVSVLLTGTGLIVQGERGAGAGRCGHHFDSGHRRAGQHRGHGGLAIRA